MKRLRVLITNTSLTDRSGTECHVRDVAIGLLRRGHAPVCYSTYLGEMAHELQAATIPVVDDLRCLGAAPDIIHGHHFPETLTALLHFPATPAIGVCHDAVAWHDAPLDFPRLRRMVAVDEACRDRLVNRHGLAEACVPIIANAVDLSRFPARAPLPQRPQRALVFSNYASENNYLGAVRDACGSTGLQLDVMGRATGTACADPGRLLGCYDVVFAKGRCALEALAVGAAAILCGTEGVGPMVTSEKFAALRRLNLGRRALQPPVSADRLAQEIGRYDPAAAAAVSVRVRAEADVDGMLDSWLALYAEVIDAHQRALACVWPTESRAAAAAVRWLMPYYREMEGRAKSIELLEQQLAANAERLAQQGQELARQQHEIAVRDQRVREVNQQLQRSLREAAHLRRGSTQVRALAGRLGRLCLRCTLLPQLAAIVRRLRPSW